MSIKVTPRVRRHEDRAGDPLDGLVNLFDLGIVLSVGFLLAALSSLNLADKLTEEAPLVPSDSAVTVPPDAEVSEVPSGAPTVIGDGTRVGEVYQLDDGRLVYVVPEGTNGPKSDGTGSGGGSSTPDGVAR